MSTTEAGKSRIRTDPFTRKGKGTSRKVSKASGDLKGTWVTGDYRVLRNERVQHVVIMLEHGQFKEGVRLCLRWPIRRTFLRSLKGKRAAVTPSSSIHQVFDDQSVSPHKGGSVSLQNRQGLVCNLKQEKGVRRESSDMRVVC